MRRLRGGETRRGWRWRALVGAGAIAAGLLGAGPAADQARGPDLRGACYCRARAELHCTADLTERECRRACALALCDDWFWKERLPCWNWGYGG